MKGEEPMDDRRIDEALSKVIANVPPELLAETQSMSEFDLLTQMTERALKHLMMVLHLYQQARSRCGVCADAERACDHCFAENEQIHTLTREAISLALMCKVATAPGTRIAAERERREEAKAAAKA
jgi:hypothetical protein